MSQQTVVVMKKKKKMYASREDKLAYIMSLFKKHIGRRNSLTRLQLFEAVYGPITEYSKLEIFFLWSKLRQDLNWLRRTTKCFVASMRIDKSENNIDWEYFVVKDFEDAKFYLECMNNTIVKCEYMKKRCLKAVEEGFYKDLLRDK